MNANQLEKLAKRQLEKGMVDHLQSGELAITVSLSTSQKLPSVPREQRKQILVEEFREKLDRLNGLEVDFNTLSLSAQTVEAKLSLNKLQQLHRSLESESLTIYPVIKQQIL